MAKSKQTSYDKLHALSKSAALMSSIQMLLEWDQETYMPSDAISIRSLQSEMMASLVHKQKLNTSFTKILGSLINLDTGAILDQSLTEEQRAALREWRRDYLKSSKLPNSFVKKFSRTTSEAVHAWGTAKKHNSFSEFAPHLEKIVALNRKKAELLGFDEHPYDALLDLFEPGMTTRTLTPLFEKLKVALSTLVKQIGTSSTPPDFLHGTFATDKQLHIAQRILKAMGFDPATSRLDQSMHPFCTGLHPKDTRMTTHIHSDNPLASIFAVIHEGGHGLYNMGLPVEHYGSPLCEPISLGIDESQSRWWETRMGLSLPFWQHFFPLLQAEFPEQLKNTSLDTFYKAINRVQPSFIRIHADEVTYSLHIIVRFEIEKALIEGSLKVKEIPETWNRKMKEYLGIVPSTDAEGCLQDIHWSMGAFGYFPTYTLGNLYASQFFASFEKEHPTWKEKVAAGDLEVVRKWLHDNIHRYGRRFTADELCKRITGSSLSEEPFLHYLHKKYQS